MAVQGGYEKWTAPTTTCEAAISNCYEIAGYCLAPPENRFVLPVISTVIHVDD